MKRPSRLIRYAVSRMLKAHGANAVRLLTGLSATTLANLASGAEVRRATAIKAALIYARGGFSQ